MQQRQTMGRIFMRVEWCSSSTYHCLECSQHRIVTVATFHLSVLSGIQVCHDIELPVLRNLVIPFMLTTSILTSCIELQILESIFQGSISFKRLQNSFLMLFGAQFVRYGNREGAFKPEHVKSGTMGKSVRTQMAKMKFSTDSDRFGH